MDFCVNTPRLIEIEPDGFWEQDTTPGLDEIQELVRQSMPHFRANYRHDPLPRAQRPIRRRLHSDDTCVKSHETTVVSTVLGTDLTFGFDNPEAPASFSPMTIVTSTTSSATTPWSSSGQIEEIFDGHGSSEWDGVVYYEQEEDHALEAKVEPVDDLDMEEYEVDDALTEITTSMAVTSAPEGPAKRGRGRPRKYPKPDPTAVNKVNKSSRSKTGCKACRDRKKKCDEAKPICVACKRNGLACVFPQVRVFQSNAKRKEEEQYRSRLEQEDTKEREIQVRNTAPSLEQQKVVVEAPPFPLPCLITGVETELDQIFFIHYVERLSSLFTTENAIEGAFRKLVLPYAIIDKGVMNSLLSLASKHIDYNSPWGKQLLRQNPGVSIEELQARSHFHYCEAFEELKVKANTRDGHLNPSAARLQIMFHILHGVVDPTTSGEHRLHIAGAQRLVKFIPETETDAEILRLTDEMNNYHIYADLALCLPEDSKTYLEQWNPPSTVMQPEAVRLLGIADALVGHMSRITNIRNRIRVNLQDNQRAVVDYHDLTEATEIDFAIRQWIPAWPQGDPRDIVGDLYKRMTWVYLYRTIYPPQITNWIPDPKIIQAVDECITLLGLIKPHEKVQTLLLMPTLVAGCAAFEERQRQKIREAIKVIKAYTGFKNSDTTLMVLTEVWKLMDLKDARSWDWQTIAHQMGMDFLSS